MGLILSCLPFTEVNSDYSLEYISELLPLAVPDAKYLLDQRFQISESSKNLVSWSEQIFQKGWNILIQDINNQEYRIIISNRYICPLLDEPCIFRGKFFETDDCVICEEQTPTQVILPCGHQCLCSRCYVQTCPLCRNPIRKILKEDQLRGEIRK